MIDDIRKAVAAYRKLAPLGRKLFRDETALEVRPRRKRRVKTAAEAPVARDLANLRKRGFKAEIAPAAHIPTGVIKPTTLISTSSVD